MKIPPKQITQLIKQMKKTELQELMMKDIYWTLADHDWPNNVPPQYSKQVQFQDCYLKVYYGAKNYIEVLFPKNVTVKFGTQYFEDYTPMKFASLVYLLLGRIGPIINPMAFHLQTVRQEIGLYKNFKYKNVLRQSLKTNPVYQTILCMTRNFRDDSI